MRSNNAYMLLNCVCNTAVKTQELDIAAAISDMHLFLRLVCNSNCRKQYLREANIGPIIPLLKC